MPRDPRVDAYIARQADFARPILEHVRAVVHEACPGVGETIKWGMPSFVHAGRILAGMAAFKQHASFGYWQHALVVGEGEPGEGRPREGMGSYGRMTSVADLPPRRTLLAHVRKAAKLAEQGVKSPAARKPATPKPPPKAPPDLLAALKANPAAKATFDAFAPSHKRDYVEWITEAKREETRAKRLAQAIEWMAEGKRRHWKYESC